MTKEIRQELFNYLNKQHDCPLLETDMDEIERIISLQTKEQREDIKCTISEFIEQNPKLIGSDLITGLQWAVDVNAPTQEKEEG